MSFEKQGKPLENEVVLPNEINSIYVDKMLVTTHSKIETATLSLFTTHMIPNFDKHQGWSIDHTVNGFVGEIKIPKSVLLDFAISYIQQLTNGLDVRPQVEQFIKNNPHEKSEFSFGPSATRTEMKD